jgi:hypothetical protein
LTGNLNEHPIYLPEKINREEERLIQKWENGGSRRPLNKLVERDKYKFGLIKKIIKNNEICDSSEVPEGQGNGVGSAAALSSYHGGTVTLSLNFQKKPALPLRISELVMIAPPPPPMPTAPIRSACCA